MNNEPAAEFHPLDAGRINASDALELAYWSREIGCSEEELKAAVAVVGTHVAAVREQLRRPAPR